MSTSLTSTKITAALALFYLGVSTLAAQSDHASEIEALKRQLASTTERLNRLESQQAETKSFIADSESKLSALPDVKLGSKGLRIASAGGNYTFRADGALQFDYRAFLGDNDGTDTFDTRRARPSIRGTLFGNWDWRLQYETDNSSIYDGYIRYTYSDALRIKFGRQKTSIGLERLQGLANTTFNERSLATNLTPTRDNGIQLSGRLLDEALLYEIGIFNGAENDGRPDTDSNNAKTVSARLFIEPWVGDKDSALQGLGFGIAGSLGHESGTAIPRYRSYGRETFFQYNSGVEADGPHSRINPNFYYYNGSFGLITEAIFDSQTFSRSGISKDVDTFAWSITPSYVMTGGINSFGGVKLDPDAARSKGGKGAWLVAARLSGFDISDDVFTGAPSDSLANPTTSAGKATAYGLSTSWYPEENIRLTLSYDITRFAEGADLKNEHLLVTRLQLAF